MDEDPISASINDAVNGCFGSLLIFFSVLTCLGGVTALLFHLYA